MEEYQEDSRAEAEKVVAEAEGRVAEGRVAGVGMAVAVPHTCILHEERG